MAFDERALVRGPQPAVPEIVPYDDGWPDRFEQHRRRIAVALGSRAHEVEHIGSTSVPGLGAKDVVDVLVVLDDPDDEAAYLTDLERAGYELRVREPGHRALRETSGRRVNVHCYAAGDDEITKYRLLREHLRAHEDARRTYEDAKRALAGREWPDMNHYAEAKGPTIHRLLREAGWTGAL
ncbi:GrpB family protein [Actinomycetospora termitidis]|uniref:GrpB family protein n=1 Tax=Actinomycetospora termitidis TaxID=3053470 RepID=A0ABT7MBM1_9PSEU|nr:GrpB family protein [Actinomycetospora sp. Odt1-22]MDL5157856.1 GrpB family protein [Actinomycetospora sp. Odt1-22]